MTETDDQMMTTMNDGGDNDPQMAAVDEQMPLPQQQSLQPPPNHHYHHHSQRHDALILLDAILMKRLQTKHRLPGTYIGVRKIRPSSREVHRAQVMAKYQKKGGQQNQQNANGVVTMKPSLPPVEFKIVDAATGLERRMTSKEKKALKQERAKLLRERKAQAKAEQQQQQEQPDQADDEAAEKSEDEESSESFLQSKVAQASSSGGKATDTNPIANDKDDSKFYYLKINPLILEQELADLRGDRNEVPPVLISSSQAHLARINNLIPPAHSSTLPQQQQQQLQPSIIPLDDAYAQKWADALRQSMMPAVATRQAESMRGMVYDIVPQVWKRLRPTFLASETVPHTNNPNGQPPVADSESTNSVGVTDDNNPPTLSCTLRPPVPSLDEDWNILMEALYRGENLHVGCGAKFGCDVLLYDGPRSERHSFAGLRLLRSASAAVTSSGARRNNDYPLPRAYDVAGYVRCLNTAGKLALVAKVIQDDDGSFKVAILDLALEKVDMKRKPKPMKSIEKRMETLAKAKS